MTVKTKVVPATSMTNSWVSVRHKLAKFRLNISSKSDDLYERSTLFSFKKRTVKLTVASTSFSVGLQSC